MNMNHFTNNRRIRLRRERGANLEFWTSSVTRREYAEFSSDRRNSFFVLLSEKYSTSTPPARDLGAFTVTIATVFLTEGFLKAKH